MKYKIYILFLLLVVIVVAANAKTSNIENFQPIKKKLSVVTTHSYRTAEINHEIQINLDDVDEPSNNLSVIDTIRVFFIAAIKNDLHTMLSVSEESKANQLEAMSKSKLEEGSEFYRKIFIGNKIYVKNIAEIDEFVILVIEVLENSTDELVFKMPFFLEKYNSEWKVLDFPSRSMVSLLAFEFSLLDGDDINKTEIVMRTRDPQSLIHEP